jgi:HAD superfamily hydrolase (TIGR01490 family)
VYEARNEQFFRQYQAGTLDIYEFLAFQLAPLARHPREELDQWHEEFMRERIEPIIRPKARDLVERHRAEGHLCAIVTSTNSFITGPISRELGFDHLLATELEVKNGEFTGKPYGTPCFREGKVTRVFEWLEAHALTFMSFPVSSFYSDSQNDLPLLRRVSRPVAVDPDEVLRREALELGWQVISLE